MDKGSLLFDIGGAITHSPFLHYSDYIAFRTHIYTLPTHIHRKMPYP